MDRKIGLDVDGGFSDWGVKEMEVSVFERLAAAREIQGTDFKSQLIFQEYLSILYVG